MIGITPFVAALPSALAYEAAFYRYLLESYDTTADGWLELTAGERLERARKEQCILETWVRECRYYYCGGT